jgi:glycosyltransferase involved in cell wall biosynthesis
MKQKGVLCNLAIIGKDVDGTNLEVLVTEFQLEDQVWFYGACYDEEEIAKLIYNADLCVSPGPIGLTALHAMTYGTPIITNDNFSKQMPEFEVIQNNETGVFYKEGDLSDLTNKITQWIGLGKTQRNNIRKKAYSIIDAKYNPHYQIGVLKDLINVT